MKSTLKKILLILLTSCLIVTVGLFFAACDKHTTHIDSDSDGKCDVCGEAMPSNDGTTGGGTTGGGTTDGGEITPDGKISYSVTLLRSSGDPLDRVTVVAYDDNEDLVAFGTTDGDGVATFRAAEGEYKVMLAPSQVPAGYHIADSYPISSENPSITIKLSASVITDKAMPSNTTYELGSVMYDFSFTDSQNRSNTLSGLLAEKKMVLLNFWFVNCTYCLAEFPDMKAAYLDYMDDVAIVALNPFDTKSEVENFRSSVGQWGEGGLPFHMVATDNPCSSDLATRFGVPGYPTTVVIDREGVVCFMADGGGTESDFRMLFEKYTAEPYEQDIVFPGENAVERPLPNVDAPLSEDIEAAINNTGSGFDASYYFIPEGEEESHLYNWPWLIGEDEDGSYIYPSNSGLNNSYAIIYTDVVITEARPVIAFDYKVSCEELTGVNGFGDALYIYLDGMIISTISGISDEWQTCYAYYPLRAGTYNLSLAYVKDDTTHEGDDTVFVKNMRFIDASDIEERFEIYYQASSGPAVGNSYTYYETVVYNATDGYYHVNDENGPLLLADLMNGNTHWSNKCAYDYVMNGGFKMNGVDVSNRFIKYCQYANNSAIYGLVAVTEELHDLLVALTEQYGNGKENANEWLELCSFHVIYGSGENEILPDPTRGLADYNAFEAVLNTGTETDYNEVNHVVIDRLLMPRGMRFKFVVPQSGAYRIMSIGDYDTYGWLLNADLEVILESDDIDFDPNDIEGSNGNFCMALYMKQGDVYYIAADFAFIGETGEFNFIITRLGDEYELWTQASSGLYSTELDADGNMILDTVYLVGAIDYELGEDGFYHALNADGTLGSIIYVNLLAPTRMFQDMSIEAMLSIEQYYCTRCGYPYFGSVADFEAEDSPICYICEASRFNGPYTFAKRTAFDLPTPVYGEDGKVVTRKVTVGDADFILPEYERNDENDILFHNYTEAMRGYCNSAETNYPTDADGTARYGYVAASAELVDILMKFIIFGDHSASPNISNAWLMLANYYQHLGPASDAAPDVNP